MHYRNYFKMQTLNILKINTVQICFGTVNKPI